MKTREQLQAKIASVRRDIEDNRRLGERRAERYAKPLAEKHEALDAELAGLEEQLAALGDDGEGEGEEKPAGRRRRTK